MSTEYKPSCFHVSCSWPSVLRLFSDYSSFGVGPEFLSLRMVLGSEGVGYPLPPRYLTQAFPKPWESPSSFFHVTRSF